jgi:hypothetical protein
MRVWREIAFSSKEGFDHASSFPRPRHFGTVTSFDLREASGISSKILDDEVRTGFILPPTLQSPWQNARILGHPYCYGLSHNQHEGHSKIARASVLRCDRHSRTPRKPPVGVSIWRPFVRRLSGEQDQGFEAPGCLAPIKSSRNFEPLLAGVRASGSLGSVHFIRRIRLFFYYL